MSIFNTYPIQINGHALPSPSSWQIALAPVESVMTTEAGTDVVDITRAGKVQITAAFKLAEGSTPQATIGQEVKILQGFATTQELTVKYYDPVTAGYATKNMRMRNFSATLVPKSDTLNGVNGVWNVNFTLIEY